MVIIRTPLRISFLGGGTDHPSWFRQHGGAVLSTTINKYIYLQIRKLPSIFDFNYRVVWRMVEQVAEVDDIQHPVVREVLRHYAPSTLPRLEIAYNADLPSRSGLGSSSAFTVALLQGLAAQQGKIISHPELAREAIFVEQELLKEPVGCQDQIAVAHGGLNRIDFMHDGKFRIMPMPLPAGKREALESHMMLFFTRFERSAGMIEATKVQNYDKKHKELVRLSEIVDEGQNILLNPNEPISRFGAMLHEGWKLKRSLSDSVSNSEIDMAYEAAMEAGATGGKLLGAGGGGFMLFIVKPALQDKVRRALSQFVEVPIRLEDRGSHIALFDPELDAAHTDAETIVHLEKHRANQRS
ncbi:MAG: kinase [Alphaproteobacteria bacterium]